MFVDKIVKGFKSSPIGTEAINVVKNLLVDETDVYYIQFLKNIIKDRDNKIAELNRLLDEEKNKNLTLKQSESPFGFDIGTKEFIYKDNVKKIQDIVDEKLKIANEYTFITNYPLKFSLTNYKPNEPVNYLTNSNSDSTIINNDIFNKVNI